MRRLFVVLLCVLAFALAGLGETAQLKAEDQLVTDHEKVQAVGLEMWKLNK